MKSKIPVVDEPGVTLGAGDGDRPPVGQVPRRTAGADHCRDAELAGDDRRVAGPAAAVGDDRRRPFHDGLPVRVGHVRDQHLARDELMHRLDRLQDPDRSGADPLPDRPPLYQHRALLVHPETLHAPDRLTGLHRLRPGLQDVQAVVDTVLSPLDVHRPPVVLLDRHGLPGQLLDLRVGQAEQPPVRGRDIHELRRLSDGRVRGVDHLGRLATDPPLQDRRPPRLQCGLVHIELVRVDRPLHHSLAQPVGRRDEHRIGEPGLGVHGEHHPGCTHIGAHHLLHPRRQRDLLMGEAVMHPVGDRPVVEQRGEHLPDRDQDGVDAANVQKRLLLTGERRVRQVLRRRRRPHRERLLLVAAGEPLVRGADVGFQVGRERLVNHRCADPPADLGQPLYVVGVQRGQLGADQVCQPGVTDETPVRIRGGGEAVRHSHAGRRQIADHLPQTRVLPAHLFQVGQPDVGEPHNVVAHRESLLFRVCTITVDISGLFV